MLLYFACMLLFLHMNGVAIGTLFSQFHVAFSAHPINVTQVNHVGGTFGHDSVLPDIPGGQIQWVLNIYTGLVMLSPHIQMGAERGTFYHK